LHLWKHTAEERGCNLMPQFSVLRDLLCEAGFSGVARFLAVKLDVGGEQCQANDDSGGAEPCVSLGNQAWGGATP